MNDLEKKIRERYLDRLEEWDCDHPREVFGMAALPYFVEAFKHEPDAKRRERLIETIWEFRDAAALPALSAALYDPSPLVWKETLNGLVVLDSEDCVKALEATRSRPFIKEKDWIYFQEWLDEAIQQIREGVLGEKKLKQDVDDTAED